tara:strand:+ start:129 stop:1328 length:1200 start_codon:yes stop_codon:yes gene_type:complete
MIKFKVYKSLIFIMFVLCVPANSKQLSKSPFIPDDILEEFDKLPKEYKSKMCGFDNYKIKKGIINKDLAPKILGYNSRMDNWKIVEGVYSRDVFKHYADAVTYASVTENDLSKEFLFNKLYTWANNKALSGTKQCYRNTKKNSILKDCEGEWSDPNGQDLAPIKDSTVTVEIVMGLNYIYNLNFSSFKVEDSRHKIINDWFYSFYKRIKPANKFYMGNSAGWYFPNIALKHNNNKDYKSLILKLVKGADMWILEDGSIKDRTTRGDRSLWYHHTGLGEAFMILEIANAANIKLPKNYEKNLLKAAELFQDAFLDNSILEPWAKKAHNAQASNGIQKFNKTLDSVSFNGPWFHIIQYRYPIHRTSKFLKSKMTPRARSLKSDEVAGIGMGCIYNALANYN